MNDLHFERLDPFSATERECYERAFYAAFQRALGNRLVRRLWLWDDSAQRVATRIPYDEQTIFVLRDGKGRIVTGLAVNHALRSFQSAAYGFSLPEQHQGCCEFLTVFSVEEYRLTTRFKFWRDSFDALRDSGFRTAYATTAHRVLNLHRLLGARILRENEIEGEVRYFLKFDLSVIRHGARKERIS
jgi:hypothetical protein